jgi:hypothetical protein
LRSPEFSVGRVRLGLVVTPRCSDGATTPASGHTRCTLHIRCQVKGGSQQQQQQQQQLLPVGRSVGGLLSARHVQLEPVTKAVNVAVVVAGRGWRRRHRLVPPSPPRLSRSCESDAREEPSCGNHLRWSRRQAEGPSVPRVDPHVLRHLWFHGGVVLRTVRTRHPCLSFLQELLLLPRGRPAPKHPARNARTISSSRRCAMLLSVGSVSVDRGGGNGLPCPDHDGDGPPPPPPLLPRSDREKKGEMAVHGEKGSERSAILTQISLAPSHPNRRGDFPRLRRTCSLQNTPPPSACSGTRCTPRPLASRPVPSQQLVRAVLCRPSVVLPLLVGISQDRPVSVHSVHNQARHLPLTAP